jgi:hypothetical protein
VITKKAYDLDEIRTRPFPEHELVEFTEKDFVSNEGNEKITICRAQKSATVDPYVFYLQVFLKTNPEIASNRDFIEHETKAIPISEELLLGIITDHLDGLSQNYKFSLKGHFVDAMKLEEEWNNITLLCETSSEIIYFNWKTLS